MLYHMILYCLCYVIWPYIVYAKYYDLMITFFFWGHRFAFISWTTCCAISVLRFNVLFYTCGGRRRLSNIGRVIINRLCLWLKLSYATILRKRRTQTNVLSCVVDRTARHSDHRRGVCDGQAVWRHIAPLSQGDPSSWLQGKLLALS